MPRTPKPSPQAAIIEQARRVATTPNPDKEKAQTIRFQQPRDAKTGKLKPSQAKPPAPKK